MLQTAKELARYAVLATDGGEVGSVERFLFDDEGFGVRYLVARAGGLVVNREVLIASDSLGKIDPETGSLGTNLTEDRIKNGPGVGTDRPVAAQRELDYPAYHGGGEPDEPLWGSGWEAAAVAAGQGNAVSAPATYAGGRGDEPDEEPDGAERRGDPHLRNTKEVAGYGVGAVDGEVGHVEDFVLDDDGWTIRYVVVDTRNWLPGKKVLVSPRWILGISWAKGKTHVDLTRDQIEGAPEWDPQAPIDRGYETDLHAHYGLSPYWARR